MREHWLLGVVALLCLAAACGRTMRRPQPPTPAPPAPMPAPAPLPEQPPPVTKPPPQPPPSPPAGVGPALTVPALLRVGLATDLPSLTVPCCGLIAEVEGEEIAVAAPLRIEPGATSAQPGLYRLQVAALKDEGQAQGLARRLAGELSEPADTVFDAGTDLYRVRVGQFSSREVAAEAQRRLELLGVGESWVVSEAGRLHEPALLVSHGGETVRVAGRWLAVRSTGGEAIAVEGGRYRGRILVYLNDRATLNLINELSPEDYLRGVVPREMGPDVYPSLEALKAQTVAARTYTFRNLGEFRSEGYDICATPRCQVYGGMAVEHPLTDRAIRETAGEVLLYDGELADALYSSTCGGHTEDVNVVFPLKDHPYLKGVPCLEAGIDRLGGSRSLGSLFPAALMARVAPEVDGGAPAAILSGRLSTLVLAAGLPIPDDRLASLERREVQRFLASILDLAADVRLFVTPQDLPYLLEDPPQRWSDEELRLAAYLVKSRLLSGALDRLLSPDEAEEMLFQVALFLHLVEEREVTYLGLEGDRLAVRRGEETAGYPIGPELVTFRPRGSRLIAAPLGLLPGDPLTIYLRGGELVGVVHHIDPDGASYDRRSRLSSWSRVRTDAELAELVHARYPGLGFRGFQILSRGVSGRVGRIRLLGADRVVEVDGLAVRWTFDLPDTWFTARRLQPPGEQGSWLFTGRGWGHGVGLCQVGAYGMSLRGHSYRQILEHYYSGVKVERLPVAETAAVGRAAAGRMGGR